MQQRANVAGSATRPSCRRRARSPAMSPAIDCATGACRACRVAASAARPSGAAAPGHRRSAAPLRMHQIAHATGSATWPSRRRCTRSAAIDLARACRAGARPPAVPCGRAGDTAPGPGNRPCRCAWRAVLLHQIADDRHAPGRARRRQRRAPGVCHCTRSPAIDFAAVHTPGSHVTGSARRPRLVTLHHVAGDRWHPRRMHAPALV